MTELFYVSICGKRGGQKFIDTVTVIPKNGEYCPEGLSPCISDRLAAETSCVADLTECPILDIKVLVSEESQGVQVDANYVVIPKTFGKTDGQKYKLAFSKRVSENGNN